MKKNVLIIMSLLTFLVLPNKVNAASVSVALNCNNVIEGQTATCTLMGKADSPISAIEGNISISGSASIERVDKSSGWGLSDNTNSSFSVVTDTNKVGTFDIVTITVKGNSVGSATINISNVIGADANYDSFSSGSTSKTFNIVSPTTTVKQTKPTTVVTTKAPPVTTTQAVTTVPVSDLTLTSVTVDDFPVTFENGNYYATVNYDTESVTVGATGHEGVQIAGTGKRALAVGKNVVSIIVTGSDNRQDTIQVVITRPEDTNNYDTSLNKLLVVGYDLNYDDKTGEYTATVPFNVKEVYVLAESNNKDVEITGAGYKMLSSGKNEVYIKVQYGDKASTEYVVHIRRSYTMIFVYSIITLIIGGLGGYIGYDKYKRSKASENQEIADNKVLADENRAIASPEISINGNQQIGVGSNIVTPEKVGATVIENDTEKTDIMEATIKPKVIIPTKVNQVSTVNEPIKVNEVKQPTTAVGGYANITNVNKTEVVPSAEPQVKVIKKVISSPVHVATPNQQVVVTTKTNE